MSEETTTLAGPATPTPASAVKETPAADSTKATPSQEPAKDQKQADVKPNDQKADPAQETKPLEAKPVVPEKYDLKLPKDSTLDAAHVEKVALYAKEKGLSNEQAQAILERESEAVASYVGKLNDEIKQKPKAWLEEAKIDKEIGGDNFKESAEIAKRVIARYGNETFKDQLNKTGFGNHPELVRIFTRIGKAMSDDQLIIPGTQGSSTKRAAEDVLYGSSEKEK